MKFGYARVSKDDQNLNLQLDALRAYGVDEIYEEKISGARAEKPQLTVLMSKLRPGDTLVIWRLDRLGRKAKALIVLAEDLEKNGIHFVSLKEELDTTTATGKFCFHIFCALAQMERDVLSERTKAGIEAARQRGRRSGRPPVDKKTIDRALRMYFSGQFSVNEILRTTSIAKATLYEYISKAKKERDEGTQE